MMTMRARRLGNGSYALVLAAVLALLVAPVVQRRHVKPARTDEPRPLRGWAESAIRPS